MRKSSCFAIRPRQSHEETDHGLAGRGRLGQHLHGCCLVPCAFLNGSLTNLSLGTGTVSEGNCGFPDAHGLIVLDLTWPIFLGLERPKKKKRREREKIPCARRNDISRRTLRISTASGSSKICVITVR